MHSMETRQGVLHCVGIGGVGVSALAQWYHHHGWRVSGSDRDPSSPTAAFLREVGIEVHAGHDARCLPTDASLVVYSDAVPYDNPERAAARAHGIPERSYFEALGIMSRSFPTVVGVAGTHGKSTTTAMLAVALRAAGCVPTAIVGALVPQFPRGSNYLPGNDSVLVVEACEYRAHLRNLALTHLVITNLEWDHTDYFANEAELVNLFQTVVSALPAGGALITAPHEPLIANVVAALPKGVALIDYTKEPVPPLALPGTHQVANAQAARAAARVVASAAHLADIDAALSSFAGVARRFEVIGKTPAGATVIDDYAHHPTEITAVLRTVRVHYPGMRVVVLFHPHLYSRTRDLFAGFVEALAHADEVFLLPIYSARERGEDFPGVCSEALVQALNRRRGSGAHLVASLHHAAQALSAYGAESVVLTLGAGEGYKVARALVAGSKDPVEQ